MDVEQNLEEIYRRVAFNIVEGNSNDHFRNHGFLLTPKGWTLSPAYDMNPTLNMYQSLLINSNTSEANLKILYESYGQYMLTEEVATRVISEVKEAMNGWKNIVIQLGIPNREISLFADRWEVK